MTEYGTTHTTAVRNDAEAAVFLEDFKAGNWVARNGGDHLVRTYDTQRHPFAEFVRTMLVDKGLVSAADLALIDGRLERLHEIVPAALRNLDDAELNAVSRAFYEQSPAFVAAYHALVRDVIARGVIGADCLFQATPTMRFHFPHQAGFQWAPRFHTDIMLGHPPQEVNVWVPLTRSFATNTMTLAGRTDSLRILESVGYDFADFARRVQHDSAVQAACHAASAPVDLRYGEMLLFDSRCLHATQYNDTDSTRISLDLRVVPVEDFATIRIPYRGTGRRRMLFNPGHYYDQRTAFEL